MQTISSLSLSAFRLRHPRRVDCISNRATRERSASETAQFRQHFAEVAPMKNVASSAAEIPASVIAAVTFSHSKLLLTIRNRVSRTKTSHIFISSRFVASFLPFLLQSLFTSSCAIFRLSMRWTKTRFPPSSLLHLPFHFSSFSSSLSMTNNSPRFSNVCLALYTRRSLQQGLLARQDEAPVVAIPASFVDFLRRLCVPWLPTRTQGQGCYFSNTCSSFRCNDAPSKSNSESRYCIIIRY